MREGVVKFDVRFERAPPPPAAWVSDLIAWRTTLWRHGLIGVDPARYGGVGFGNVSRRLPPEAGRGFVISGSQTSALETVTASHFAVVTDWDLATNCVTARGITRPSSESLTHAMLYALLDAIDYVFHVHAPAIWRSARSLGLPTTASDVDYGTPAMAQEVARLFREGQMPAQGVFAMGGHEDGVVSYAASAETAGSALVSLLARSVR